MLLSLLISSSVPLLFLFSLSFSYLHAQKAQLDCSYKCSASYWALWASITFASLNLFWGVGLVRSFLTQSQPKSASWKFQHYLSSQAPTKIQKHQEYYFKHQHHKIAEEYLKQKTWHHSVLQEPKFSWIMVCTASLPIILCLCMSECAYVYVCVYTCMHVCMY